DKYISNLELMPYHLTGMTLPNTFNPQQLDYITQRFQNNLKFARKYKPRLFIFNGNAWYIPLVKNFLIPHYEKIKITGSLMSTSLKLRVYLPCYLTNFFRGIFGE
ncbi:MAG: hypothetical protein ACRD8Z_01165, partial [Nitrososphaeraceae archaeon]